MATLGHPLHMHGKPKYLSRTPSERQRRFFIHFGVYLAVNIGLAALNITRNPDHLWFYWVAAGWGIGVGLHGARAFSWIDDPHGNNLPTAVEKPNRVDSMAGDEGI